MRYTGGMTAKPSPTDLTDAAWDLIKDLIPPPNNQRKNEGQSCMALPHAVLQRWGQVSQAYISGTQAAVPPAGENRGQRKINLTPFPKRKTWAENIYEGSCIRWDFSNPQRALRRSALGMNATLDDALTQ